MDQGIAKYWRMKLARLCRTLKENGFEAHWTETSQDALRLVMEDILPALGPSSVSFGGSVSVVESGLYQALKARPGVTLLDTFKKELPAGEKHELRRRALSCDLFVTGSNAITEAGELVNLDGVGNRVAALAFGPRNVLVLAGRNKVVDDLACAFTRVKSYAAPVNALRLNKKTPCVKTGSCQDCSSPDRICSVWTITEKSWPSGRIVVVLVNEDLGF